ncbi:MAG TPA: hypothetical protein VMY42_19290 [Thermoguttaceae bacterium]|nr:hypothetical protein [Thermoguttaceae bacterium]
MYPPRLLTTGFLLALFLPTAARTAAAQDPAETTDPVLVALDGRIKSFLEGVSLGQTQNAYQELLADSQLAKQDQALKDLVTQTIELHAKYGEYRGFEQIAARRVGQDLVLLKYLYKCEHFPVVWYLTFYRTPPKSPPENGDWRVIIVRFDTELELLAF